MEQVVVTLPLDPTGNYNHITDNYKGFHCKGHTVKIKAKLTKMILWQLCNT